MLTMSFDEKLCLDQHDIDPALCIKVRIGDIVVGFEELGYKGAPGDEVIATGDLRHVEEMACGKRAGGGEEITDNRDDPKQAVRDGDRDGIKFVGLLLRNLLHDLSMRCIFARADSAVWCGGEF